MCNIFADLFEKKRKTLRIRGEWNRLISSIAYSDIADETGFDACVKMFVNGLIWQKRREQSGAGNEADGRTGKAEPGIKPELLRLIDEIVRGSEEKNGALKDVRKGRRSGGGADAPLTRLDRDEIKDFIHSLHDMRDEVQPGRLWRGAVSRFMGEFAAAHACLRGLYGIVPGRHHLADEPKKTRRPGLAERGQNRKGGLAAGRSNHNCSGSRSRVLFNCDDFNFDGRISRYPLDRYAGARRRVDREKGFIYLVHVIEVGHLPQVYRCLDDMAHAAADLFERPLDIVERQFRAFPDVVGYPDALFNVNRDHARDEIEPVGLDDV
jgi:hypothetical protein